MGGNNRQTNGSIVRKLPGIGVVSSSRPTTASSSKHESTKPVHINDENDDNTNDDPDDDFILYSPDAEPRCPPPSRKKPDKRKQPDPLNTSQLSQIDTDSDDDFNSRLSKLRTQRKTAKKLNKAQSQVTLRHADGSPAGTRKKVGNFMSVSNPNSPKFVNLAKNEDTSFDDADVIALSLLEFTRNRNKRAHELSDDDDVTEVERPGGKKSKAGTSAATNNCIVIDDDASGNAPKFVSCPVCGAKCVESSINAHLDTCLA